MKKLMFSLLLASTISINALVVDNAYATNFYTSYVQEEKNSIFKSIEEESKFKLLVRYKLFIWLTSKEVENISNQIKSFDSTILNEQEKDFLEKIKVTINSFENWWFKWIDSYQKIEWIDDKFIEESKKLFWWRMNSNVFNNTMLPESIHSWFVSNYINIANWNKKWEFPTQIEMNSFLKLRHCWLVNSWFSYKNSLVEFFNKISCYSKELWVYKEDDLWEFDVHSFIKGNLTFESIEEKNTSNEIIIK